MIFIYLFTVAIESNKLNLQQTSGRTQDQTTHKIVDIFITISITGNFKKPIYK